MGSQKSTVRIPITYVIMIRSLLMICYHQFSCLNLFTEVNKGTSFQRHKLLPKKGLRRISSSQGVRTGLELTVVTNKAPFFVYLFWCHLRIWKHVERVITFNQKLCSVLIFYLQCSQSIILGPTILNLIKRLNKKFVGIIGLLYFSFQFRNATYGFPPNDLRRILIFTLLILFYSIEFDRQI